MEVGIDRDVCIAAGQCEVLAPATFEVGDDGIAHVIGRVEDGDAVSAALQACPSGAIHLVTEGGG